MKLGKSRRLPAEWAPQDGVQLTWPHGNSDWAGMLSAAEACFVQIALAIAQHEKLIIACHDPEHVARLLKAAPPENLLLFSLPTNDTWARDHAPLSVMVDGKWRLLDFQFNGWGLKFAANHDNALTLGLDRAGAFQHIPVDTLGFVLEGGAVESDGEGTILTTAQCLLSYHRNPGYSKNGIEAFLKQVLGAERLLWLESGHLLGDDTDAHIDTLARFADPQTILYHICDQQSDPHFEPLQAMEEEIKSFRTMSGNPYRLMPLLLPDPIFADHGHRLPATYANFLILNDAVLMPTYNQPQKDAAAAEVLQEAFPSREVIGIDCRVLIEQHGSLHCVTMQYPKGVLV